MKLRISIVDLTVGIVVLVAIFLPARSMRANAAYAATPDQVRDLARHQARLAAAPSDGIAADDLAAVLLDLKQTDWAIRVAGQAATHRDSPTSWRALLAVSMAHADRVEVADAHAFAIEALKSCRAAQTTCPSYEEVRLALYEKQLEAGISSGIDPRIDPDGFRRAAETALRTVRLRGANATETPSVPAPDQAPVPTPGQAPVPAPTPEPQPPTP